MCHTCAGSKLAAVKCVTRGVLFSLCVQPRAIPEPGLVPLLNAVIAHLSARQVFFPPPLRSAYRRRRPYFAHSCHPKLPTAGGHNNYHSTEDVW